MKVVRYTLDAAKDLHGNMAARVRGAINEFAAGNSAHANNVTRLVGSTGFRLPVGDFRVVFEDGATEIVITKVAPRGNIYD